MKFEMFDTVELNSEDSRESVRGFLMSFDTYHHYFSSDWFSNVTVFDSKGYCTKNNTKIFHCRMVLFEKFLDIT